MLLKLGLIIWLTDLLRVLKIWLMFSVRNIFLLICNVLLYRISIISDSLRMIISLKLIDICYNGLTVESRTYLDSCAGCIFRERTADEAGELMANIAKNHDDWTIPEPSPAVS